MILSAAAQTKKVWEIRMPDLVKTAMLAAPEVRPRIIRLHACDQTQGSKTLRVWWTRDVAGLGLMIDVTDEAWRAQGWLAVEHYVGESGTSFARSWQGKPAHPWSGHVRPPLLLDKHGDVMVTLSVQERGA